MPTTHHIHLLLTLKQFIKVVLSSFKGKKEKRNRELLIEQFVTCNFW